jgi:hypothetical protein
MYWLFPTKSEQLQKIIANEVAQKVKPEVVIEAWTKLQREMTHIHFYLSITTRRPYVREDVQKKLWQYN